MNMKKLFSIFFAALFSAGLSAYEPSYAGPWDAEYAQRAVGVDDSSIDQDADPALNEEDGSIDEEEDNMFDDKEDEETDEDKDATDTTDADDDTMYTL